MKIMNAEDFFDGVFFFSTALGEPSVNTVNTASTVVGSARCKMHYFLRSSVSFLVRWPSRGLSFYIKCYSRPIAIHLSSRQDSYLYLNLKRVMSHPTYVAAMSRQPLFHR